MFLKNLNGIAKFSGTRGSDQDMQFQNSDNSAKLQIRLQNLGKHGKIEWCCRIRLRNVTKKL